MKISAAQIQPVKGNIEKNIKKHIKFIELAISNKAEIIIFPELSLTGYEPKLAKELGANKDDKRLDIFQEISNKSNLAIGVGIPLKNPCGITISMIIFQPDKRREVYSKKFIHADEEPFFISGENIIFLNINDKKISPAICYELSVPEHPENAFKHGAEIYLASVVKSVSGVEKACKSLSEIARKYSMSVLMVNSVGESDNFLSAGKSSVWNRNGKLLGHLDGTNEGILIFDTDSEEIIKKYL